MQYKYANSSAAANSKELRRKIRYSIARCVAQISVKLLGLLVIAACLTILLVGTDIRRFTAIFMRSTIDEELLEEPVAENHALFQKKGKVVLLFSNQRSGSTFVGEFFNKNPAAFYLFEPLFSFSLSCELKYEERLETLAQMSTCDFRDVPRAYKDAHKANHYNDIAGRCLTDNVCFYTNQDRIVEKYGPMCLDATVGKVDLTPYKEVGFSLAKLRQGKLYEKSRNCGKPFNMTLLSALCSSSDFVAYKILRVCDLERLQQTYSKLQAMGNQVYIIHLVRDPRGIVNSALHAELKPDGVSGKSNHLCSRMNTNAKYVADKLSGPKSVGEFISDGRYLFIRYEDITDDVLKAANDIYKFIGIDIPDVVIEWLKDATDPEARIKEYHTMLQSQLTEKERSRLFKRLKLLVQKKKDTYGTVRDTKLVASKWRKSMKMEHVDIVQEHCANVMKRFGYKLVYNERELTDMDTKLW